jgi:hypothetical protein
MTFPAEKIFHHAIERKMVEYFFSRIRGIIFQSLGNGENFYARPIYMSTIPKHFMWNQSNIKRKKRKKQF